MGSYRPKGCKCAGYVAPRFDPRITNGPGPHPKIPSNMDYLNDIATLEKRVAEKDDLHDTKLGYVKPGEPVPLTDDATDEMADKPLLEKLKVGYDG